MDRIGVQPYYTTRLKAAAIAAKDNPEAPECLAEAHRLMSKEPEWFDLALLKEGAECLAAGSSKEARAFWISQAAQRFRAIAVKLPPSDQGTVNDLLDAARALEALQSHLENT